MGKFEKTLAFGRVGEGLISRWLQSRGHLVFPAYQVEYQTGKGPQLFGASGDLVLPDLMAFRGGEIRWFEAKHKTCFSWHRKSGQWVTGIDLRHYGEYQEVAARTGLPVWLLFYHPKDKPDARDLQHKCPDTCPTGLYGNDICQLALTENHRHENWGPSGMVYWAEGALKRIARAEELAA
jgi:hypothetical protein